MFAPIDWSRFPQELPVTFVVTIICVGLWAAANLGLVTPQVTLPRDLSLSTWVSHFFHLSLLHLVSNLLIVLFMGVLLERPLGWWRYAVLLGLVWNLTVLGLYWYIPDPALGFSGIGLGLMVLAFFYWQDDKPTAQMLGVLLLLNLVFGLMPGVSWHGHVVGALSGLVVYGLIRAAQMGQKR